MNIDQLRQLCLSFPGATEQIQWGDVLLFKVGGRMFALTPLEPASPWLSLKADPEAFAELVERPGIIPAPYLARAKWIAIETRDALPASEVAALLRQSYELVVAKLPRAAREKLSRPKTEAKPRGARRKARPPRAASRKTRP
ncbi:MAG TPA: MmcQ/YjbR family DNA-binding protein [Candidatus Acidoferrum sp.]